MHTKNLISPLIVLTELRKAFGRDKTIMLKADSQIVFLFGGQIAQKPKSSREEFYVFAKRHLTKYRFLLAEDFFKLDTQNIHDLLTIEEELASYTDCVLIILESPGTFAEIGAFAVKDNLTKIILTINDISHLNSKSFLSLGPIAKIDRESKFGPTIYADLKTILKSTNTIQQRLDDKLRTNNKTVKINHYIDFIAQKNRKLKLFLVADMISIFSPVSLKELVFIFRYIYITTKTIDINYELNILKSLGYIYSSGGYLINSNKDDYYFFTYSVNIEKLRAKVLNHYFKNKKEKMRLLVENKH